jgi:radical SAM protein with 4Fe4S-binding SPASM domain
MCAFSDPRVEGIRGHDMPMWLFRRVADQVFPHARYVALSCLGEPYMTRDLGERLGVLRDHPGLESEIITNGTLLNDKRIEELIASGLSRIGVSLDGATREVYEGIRIGARFDRVIGNITKIIERKSALGVDHPSLRLLHVISEANVDHFAEFLDLAESLGVDSIDVRTIQPFTNARDRGTNDPVFWAKVAACGDLFDEWLERTGVANLGYLRKTPDEVVLHDESGEPICCRAAFDNLTVLFNGDVVPCTAWDRPPVGNLAHQSFDEIWNGEPARALRREFDEKRPGRDCVYCTITRGEHHEDGDAFFRILTADPPPAEPFGR